MPTGAVRDALHPEAALAGTVLQVVLLSSEPQMVRVDAVLYVAGMAHELPSAEPNVVDGLIHEAMAGLDPLEILRIGAM